MSWIVLTQAEWDALLADVASISKSVAANAATLSTILATENKMDAQVTALATNLTTLTGLISTYVTDVTAALALQSSAIDSADEAGIVAANATMTTLATNLQAAIAAIPLAPAPAPGP